MRIIFFFPRNILELMDAFGLPEGAITENNYTEALHKLNSTHPRRIQNLTLRTCDMQVFLSEVPSVLNVSPQTKTLFHLQPNFTGIYEAQNFCAKYFLV